MWKSYYVSLDLLNSLDPNLDAHLHSVKLFSSLETHSRFSQPNRAILNFCISLQVVSFRSNHCYVLAEFGSFIFVQVSRNSIFNYFGNQRAIIHVIEKRQNHEFSSDSSSTADSYSNEIASNEVM